MLNLIFKHKIVNYEKLLNFGFRNKNNNYTYEANILNGQFCLIIDVLVNGEVKTQLIDTDAGCEYILHLTDASGAFVGKVRAEYQEVLQTIADKCFNQIVFKSKEAGIIVQYTKDKYQSELEFLWKKFSNNAIARRNDNKKWYLALLIISGRKIGLNTDEEVEIIDLRGMSEQLETLIDNHIYFSGYHMNKKYWYTICLNGSVNIDEICKRIDESYALAKK